jgi:hypothetical protein
MILRSVRGTTVAVSLAASALVAGAVAASAAPSQLTGHGRGIWTLKPANPDVGTTRVVHGHGHFSIGDAKIRGKVTAPGFVIEGSCGVAVRLVTDTGSIKVVGHSKVESRSSGTICDGHAFRFHFHTAKGTGDLSGTSFKGVGRAELADKSDEAYQQGTFTLKLHELPA